MFTCFNSARAYVGHHDFRPAALWLSLVLALNSFTAFANDRRATDVAKQPAASAIPAASAEKTVAPNHAPGKPAEDAAKNADTTTVAARAIELLEERVRQLEARLAQIARGEAPASTTGNSASPNVAPSTMPNLMTTVSALRGVQATNTNLVGAGTTSNAASAPQAAAKADDAGTILHFFKDVEVSGLVDGYYSYNTNKVDLFTQGRAFDVRHNAFSLQLAKVTLERKNSRENPLGFRVDLGLGETVDRVISVSDASRNDATKHILQAYASYVAPLGSGLALEFGKFYTPVGAEVIETKDNFNYSRGWLFTYGPYYHAGLRAKYAVNSKVALTGFLVNGWDNLFENNVRNGKTVGFQIGLTPTSKFSLTQTYLVGEEAPLANVPAASARDNMRHVADTVATVYVNDKFTLLGNLVFGSDGDKDGNRGSWQGFAGYFKYAFTDKLAFSPRFEVLRDRAGLRTGLGQTVKDLTLTQEVKLRNHFITRFEFRRDFSDQAFFTNARSATRKDQNTFIIGLSYFFTTRE